MSQVSFINHQGTYVELTEAGKEKVEAAIREQYAQGVKEPEVELDLDGCDVSASYDYEKEKITASVFFLDQFDDEVENEFEWVFKRFAL